MTIHRYDGVRISRGRLVVNTLGNIVKSYIVIEIEESSSNLISDTYNPTEIVGRWLFTESFLSETHKSRRIGIGKRDGNLWTCEQGHTIWFVIDNIISNE